MTVTGSGSALTATAILQIGETSFSIGSMTIADGAVVTSPGVTGIGQGSTLSLGAGGLSGSIITPGIINEGQIVANFTDTLVLSADISDVGSLTKMGSGTLVLTGNNTYTGGTTVTGGLINFMAGNLGTGTITLNGGGLQWAAGNTSDISGQLAAIGAGGATFDTNGNNVSFASTLSGTGGLTKAGNGTLTLAGATYLGVTNVTGGTLQAGAANAFSPTSPVTVASGATLALAGFNQTIASLAGAGSVTLGAGTLTAGGDNSNTTFSGTISGTGGLTKTGGGQLILSGANTYTGTTIVNAGTLTVNGSLAGAVTVGSSAVLSGTGRVAGLTNNGGTIAPGNSMGTLTVTGNFAQNGGIYQVEVNAAGQNDRINATGSANLNGGTVQVLAQSGTYARNTTYTILNATGGLNGAYSGVTSNFAFLTPSLSYDANNVYLLLFQSASAFAAGAQTPNQYAVGTVLDQVNATATGDFNTVLNALSVLGTQQGPAALNAISGQQYADFGTTNLGSGALFMNAVGQQMALARGAAGGGQRQALAQACEIEACDGISPWSVWASALGGLGSVAGNGNSSTLTYNFGGAAAGIDYRLDPRFLVGLSAGYAAGNQWVDSFMGRGWTDTVSVIGYGSFTQAGFYADALAGYAWSGNQLQRQIQIPGLQRTANGSTGANQFLGQIETGYRIGHLRAGRGQRDAVRPPAGRDGDAERLLRMGRQFVEPQRGAANDQLAAHGVRRRPRRRPPAGQRAQPRARPAPGLAARIRRYRPADHGRLRRGVVQRLHRLWRDAPARRRGDRLLCRQHHRRGDAALPALRRRDRRGIEQPHTQSRPAHLLVVNEARPASSRYAPSARLRPRGTASAGGSLRRGVSPLCKSSTEESVIPPNRLMHASPQLAELRMIRIDKEIFLSSGNDAGNNQQK